jgi:hypothetical protein
MPDIVWVTAAVLSVIFGFIVYVWRWEIPGPIGKHSARISPISIMIGIFILVEIIF